MLPRCLWTAVLLGATLLTPAAHAQDAAAPDSNKELTERPSCALPPQTRQRVDAMLQSSNTVDYHGTLLIEFANDREFIEVSSAQARGEGMLTRLSRKAGGEADTFSLDSHLPVSACDLIDFYDFGVETGKVVAGRGTYRLTIRPRDTLRLGYVMELDAEYHLPLRVVTATPDGQVLERFEFARVEMAPAIDPAREASSGDSASFGFNALPRGFQVVSQGLEPVDHVVLSDGLAAISVFMEAKPKALSDGEGVVLRGSTIAYTRGTGSGQLVTVMGEIPITTARLLADAVRPVAGAKP